MYDDYDGPTSFYNAYKVALAIAAIITFIYLIYLFVIKVKQRKLEFALNDILKLLWMIISVIILLYILSLFFPELSIDAAQEKFIRLMPFRRRILGAVTSFLGAFFIAIFCAVGIANFFEKPNKENNNPNNIVEK